MLQRLLIQNYAIIERIDLEFSGKLSIITGETGAGKSILLGALELVLGKRADTKVLYNQEKKCIVEATFSPEEEIVNDLFEKYDLEDPEEIIIRREISATGKSRAFINDTPVTLNILTELSSRLLELHRQFDTLEIYQTDFQAKIVDALADNLEKVSDYSRLFQEYKLSVRDLQDLEEKKLKAEEEQEYLQFQFDELDVLKLEEFALDELETEVNRLNNAEEIITVSSSVHNALTEDENALTAYLSELIQKLRKISAFVPSLPSIIERLDSSLEEIRDASVEIEAVGAGTQYDEERILEIQQRLDDLYRIQQKHRTSELEELIQLKNELQEKLQSHSDLTTRILKLKSTITSQKQNLEAMAAEISKNRKAKAPELKKSIESMLQKLAMEHARISIDIQPSTELLPNGKDYIEFLFSPNKGSQFSSIRNIASGGELSRLALAIKANVANALTLPTMIFDELDTGISGDVAMKMGDILYDLARTHQIIAITHSPLIASKADKHYSVYKLVEENKTLTQIKVLHPDDRIYEIAKMLGGDPPADSAVQNARDLLKVTT